MPVRGFRPPNRRYENVAIAEWVEDLRGKQALEQQQRNLSPRLRNKTRDLAPKIGEAHNVPRLAAHIPLSRAINVSDVKSAISDPNAPLYSSFSRNEIFDPAVDQYLVLQRKLRAQAYAEQRRQTLQSAREHRTSIDDARNFHDKCSSLIQEDRRVRAKDNETVERIVQEHDRQSSMMVLEGAAAGFDHRGDHHDQPTEQQQQHRYYPHDKNVKHARPQSAATGTSSSSRPTSGRLIPRSTVIAVASTAAAAAAAASSSSSEKQQHPKRPTSARERIFAAADRRPPATVEEVAQQQMRNVEAGGTKHTRDSLFHGDHHGVSGGSDDEYDADDRFTFGGGGGASEEEAASAAAGRRPARPMTAPAQRWANKNHENSNTSPARRAAAAAAATALMSRAMLQQLKNEGLKPTFLVDAEAFVKTDVVCSASHRKAVAEAAALRAKVAQASARMKSSHLQHQPYDRTPSPSVLNVRELHSRNNNNSAPADESGDLKAEEDEAIQQHQQQREEQSQRTATVSRASGTSNSFFVTQPAEHTAAASASATTSDNAATLVASAAGTNDSLSPSASLRRPAPAAVGRYPSGSDVPTTRDLLTLISQCNAERAAESQQQQQQNSKQQSRTHSRAESNANPLGAFSVNSGKRVVPARPSTARVYSYRAQQQQQQEIAVSHQNSIEAFEQRRCTDTVPFVRPGAVQALQEWLSLSPRGSVVAPLR